MKLFAVSVVFYFIWECFMKAWNGERVWTWIKGLVSTEHLKEFFVYNSTSPVRAHLWFLPALIYCYLLALLIEKWRMRRAAYCMAPVLLAILLWRAEFCVFFDRFYHTMEYRNFLFTGMSFFLTGQMIHEYQDKIGCKRQEQWMQWGLKAGMSFGVALSMMEYAFRGAGEIYTGNCVAVICLFLWLILYGREINFPSVLVETGRKYAFLIYLLHPAMSDLLKKCSEGLGVSVMLAGNMGQGALNVLTFHHIKVIRGCSGNILEVAADYLSGKLTDSGVGCSSHEHHHECHGHSHKE